MHQSRGASTFEFVTGEREAAGATRRAVAGVAGNEEVEVVADGATGRLPARLPGESVGRERYSKAHIRLF